MKPSNTIIVSSEYIKEKEQQIERLQEQLEEANEVINACCSLPETNWVVTDSYKEKWGVK